MDEASLIAAARAARENAWAPYSRFRVGAAVLCADGTIVAGCNVENRSFGLAVCAERNAITTAVALGHRRFEAIAVVTATSSPALPCGLCRETIAEFSDDMPVIVANLDGEVRRLRSADLFPEPFRWPEDEALDGGESSGGSDFDDEEE